MAQQGSQMFRKWKLTGGVWRLDEGFAGISYRLYGRPAKRSGTKPWYLGQHVILYRNESPTYEVTKIYYNINFGKEIYLSPRSGIAFDVGLSMVMASFSTGDYIDSSSGWFMDNLFPSLGLRYFWSF